MRIENEQKLDYSNVLIRPKRSTTGSRKEVELKRKFMFKYSNGGVPPHERVYNYTGIPIIASNMDGVGTFLMGDVLAKLGLMTCLVKTYTQDELITYYNIEDHCKPGQAYRTRNVIYSMGIGDNDFEKFKKVYEQTGPNIKYVCIDVANGYSERFLNFCKRFRDTYPNVTLMAGNVVTGEMTEELILNGTDIVKVGIGPGSVCTTRIKTGVGYPQLSAVIECADAAHGLGGHIIADGGCNSSGDVAKAFAGGADFVMLGGMLAGHDEGGGVVNTAKKTVQFYGMSSEKANEKHFGGLNDYRAAEGKVVEVPYRGTVRDTVQEILGGIRSACTYTGAVKLKQLSKCTTFIRCYDTHNRVYE